MLRGGKKTVVRRGAGRRLAPARRPAPAPAPAPAGDAELRAQLERAEATISALQGSEARYRILAEATLVGVYVILDGKLVYANSRAAEIFGYTRAEVLNMNVMDLVAPESRPLVAENIRRRLAGEVESLRYGARMLHKSGTVMQVEVHGGAALYDGRPAIVGTVVDRTEEHRAAEALRRSEANYRALMEQAADAIIVADSTGRFLDVNTKALELVGYDREQLLALGSSVIAADDLEQIPLRFDELLRSGRLDSERRLRRKDGSIVEVEIHASVLEDGRLLGIVRDITERKRAELALRASEDRFQAFMENSPSIAFMKDADGRFVYANRAFHLRLGIEPGAAIGRRVAELFPAASARVMIESDREVLATGRTVELMNVLPGADGQPRHLLVFKFPVDDPGGRLVGGVAIDVTERVSAEKALAEQRQILQSILDSMGDGVAVTDETGEFLIFNPAARRITGLGPMGRTPEEWMERYGIFLPDGTTPHPPQDLPLARAMRGEATDGCELLLRNPVHPEGVWMRVTGRPLVDEKGAVRGGVVVFHDTTQSRRMIDDLARAETRYRALVEQLPVITYTGAIEPFGATLYVSPQLEQLLGYSPAEWVGQPDLWQRCLHPDDRPRVLAEFDRWHERGERLAVEYRMRARDGRTVWFRDEAVLVHDSEGRPAFSQGVLLDITEREVERRGRVRLQALSMDLVAVQEAERRRIGLELHDEIGQTLTGLRLKLAAAVGLPRGELALRLEEAEQLVDEAMQRVRELSQNLRPSALDDLGLLPALVSYFRRYTRQTGVQVQFEDRGVERRRFPPDLETAAYRIVQEALTNVARHARVKTVHVRCWLDAQGLGVQVEDQGGGFDSEAALARDQTRGLAGMRERAALLGGRFVVESAPGSGCRLTAALPLGEEQT